jgi:hypothetical protein
MSVESTHPITTDIDHKLFEDVLAENPPPDQFKSIEAYIEDRKRFLHSMFSSGYQTREQLESAIKVYEAINQDTSELTEPRTAWPDEQHATSVLLSSVA